MKLAFILSVIIVSIIDGVIVSAAFLPSGCRKATRPSQASLRQLRTALFQKKISSDSIVVGFWNRRNVLKSFSGALLLGVPLLLEAYARSGPVQTSMDDVFQHGTSPGINPDVRDITIIFHGAGGQDEYTDDLLRVLSSVESKSRFVKMVDWSKDSTDLLQASVKGSKIGSQIGSILLDMLSRDATTKDRRVHVVGISVGAFAANSLIQTLDSDLTTRKKTYLQLTLLDPFQQKAALGLNYGNRNFGKGSDFAQQYLNTDDPVPSTNAPLQYCATTDVTSLRPREIFGHDWPLIYYTQELRKTGSNGFIPSERREEIGSLKVL